MVRGDGPSYPWFTGSMRRIGFSRVCSSITCAMSPGVRAIMKMPLNAGGHSQIGKNRRR